MIPSAALSHVHTCAVCSNPVDLETYELTPQMEPCCVPDCFEQAWAAVRAEELSEAADDDEAMLPSLETIVRVGLGLDRAS